MPAFPDGWRDLTAAAAQLSAQCGVLDVPIVGLPGLCGDSGRVQAALGGCGGDEWGRVPMEPVPLAFLLCAVKAGGPCAAELDGGRAAALRQGRIPREPMTFLTHSGTAAAAVSGGGGRLRAGLARADGSGASRYGECSLPQAWRMIAGVAGEGALLPPLAGSRLVLRSRAAPAAVDILVIFPGGPGTDRRGPACARAERAVLQDGPALIAHPWAISAEGSPAPSGRREFSPRLQACAEAFSRGGLMHPGFDPLPGVRPGASLAGRCLGRPHSPYRPGRLSAPPAAAGAAIELETPF